MIKIHADKKSLCIRITGHAGYAPKGQDIVCAAVSALVYAYVEELMKLGIGGVLRDDEEMLATAPMLQPEKARIAFDMAVGGFEFLNINYASYIQLEIGE